MAFDLFLLIAVTAGLITGAWKGMAWQLAGIASVVLGFVGGRPLSAMVSAQLEEPDLFTRFLVFAICYGAISMACYLVALALRKKLEKEEMKRFDRHMGAFLGAFHGLVLCATVTMFLIALVPSSREPILSRTTGRLVGQTISAMHGVLPEGMHDVLHPYMHPDPVGEPAGDPGGEPGGEPAGHGEGHGDDGHGNDAPAPPPPVPEVEPLPPG